MLTVCCEADGNRIRAGGQKDALASVQFLIEAAVQIDVNELESKNIAHSDDNSLLVIQKLNRVSRQGSLPDSNEPHLFVAQSSSYDQLSGRYSNYKFI